MDPQKVKDYYQEIQKVIDQVGYAIQGVFPNEEGICVCYTIGLSPLLGAECIVAGPISLQTLYQTLRSNIDELIKDKDYGFYFSAIVKEAAGYMFLASDIEKYGARICMANGFDTIEFEKNYPIPYVKILNLGASEIENLSDIIGATD